MKIKFTNHSVSGISRRYHMEGFSLNIPGRKTVTLDVPESIVEKVCDYLRKRFPAVAFSDPSEEVKAEEKAQAPVPEADVPETESEEAQGDAEEGTEEAKAPQAEESAVTPEPEVTEGPAEAVTETQAEEAPAEEGTEEAKAPEAPAKAEPAQAAATKPRRGRKSKQ